MAASAVRTDRLVGTDDFLNTLKTGCIIKTVIMYNFKYLLKCLITDGFHHLRKHLR